MVSLCRLFNDFQLPYVSHLLFLLTRKEDVKMFRIRKLLSLITGRVVCLSVCDNWTAFGH